MSDKISLVIASVLKPVDDPRMYEKFARSLAATGRYAVNIIGFLPRKEVTDKEIRFYPLFDFHRLSGKRLLANFKCYQALQSIQPQIIIVTTPELYPAVALFQRKHSGCVVLYDIQENYDRNIHYNQGFGWPWKNGMRWMVRQVERRLIRRAKQYLLAERGYVQEMPQLPPERTVIIQNKVVLFQPKAAILTLEKFNKICRHSGGRHPGSSCSDSAPAPGEESYPESPCLKPQTGNFTDAMHGLKEGDSGSFAPPGADALRYANVRTASTVDDGKVRIAESTHKKDVSDSLSIIYTGTVSKVYGIRQAMHLVQTLIEKCHPDATFTIVGHIPQHRLYRDLRIWEQQYAWLQLVIDKKPLPHSTILSHISQADWGIVSHQPVPSIANCFPTRIWEYMAYQLPFLLQDHPYWTNYCAPWHCAVALDFNNFNAEHVYEQMRQKPFYPNGMPGDIYWEQEAPKLLDAVASGIMAK